MPAASDVCPYYSCYEDVQAFSRTCAAAEQQAEWRAPRDVPQHVTCLTPDATDLAHLFRTIRKHALGIAAWPAAKSAEQTSEDLRQLTGLFRVLNYLLRSNDSYVHVEFVADQLTGLVAQVGAHCATLADTTSEQAARELQLEYVHACLHVHWGAVSTLHILSTQWPGKRICARRALLLLPDCRSAATTGTAWGAKRATTASADLPAFEQHALLTLWNLATLARRSFGRAARTQVSGDASPFTCRCVRDLWAHMVALLETRPAESDEERFWPMLDRLCDLLIHSNADVSCWPPTGPLDSRTILLPLSAARCHTGAGFYLWLVRHLAPLCVTMHNSASSSVVGQPCKRPSENSPQALKNFAVLKKLIEELLKQVPDEASCAGYVECVLTLHRLWGLESDFGTLQALWNHFSKHLNMYSVPTTSSESSSMAYGFSPTELLRNCKRLADDRTAGSRGLSGRASKTASETSWTLFLRVLYLNMHTASQLGEWKKLFGRLLVRFKIPTIQTLTEVGLYNFVKMCLMMSLAGDAQISSAKMVDLLSHIEPGGTNRVIGVSVWSGVCAASMLCLERGCDVATLATTLDTWLSHYCRELRRASTATAYTQAWAPLPSLLAAFEELVSCTDRLDFSQLCALRSDSLADLVQGCRRAGELGTGGEADRMLSFLSVVLARIRLHHRNKCCGGTRTPVSAAAASAAAVSPGIGLATLQDCLWQHAYPYLVDFVACDQESLADSTVGHAITTATSSGASPDAVAAAAVGFTYLATLCSGSGGEPGSREPATVFADFSGWRPYGGSSAGDSAGQAVLLYVNHVLTDPELVSQLQRRLPPDVQSFSRRVMSTWLMACAELPAESAGGLPAVDDLFREIRCQAWFYSLWQLEPCAADAMSRTHSGSLLGLLGAAAEASASRGGDVRARTALRETMCDLLRDLPAAAARAVREGDHPSKQMESMYYFCAHLVHLCAPLIYAKGQVGCLLTAILDRLVLPRVLFSSKKALPPARLALMKDYLPLFLSGLASLDYRKDAYIGRKTRDIVWNYLIKFAPSKTDDWSCHPLLAVLQPTLLSEAVSAPVADDTAIRICIVESLATYIGDADPCDNYADEAKATGLRFLTELVSRTKNGKYLLRDAGTLLELLLQCCAFGSDSKLASCSLDVLRNLLKCLRDRVDESVLLSSDLPALLKGYLSSALTDATKAATILDVLHKVSSLCVPLVASVASICVSAVEKFEAGRPISRLRHQCKLLLQSLGGGSSRAAEERLAAGSGMRP